jgi:ABC-type proline/glycine betaine transport system ATPase subunit
MTEPLTREEYHRGQEYVRKFIESFERQKEEEARVAKQKEEEAEAQKKRKDEKAEAEKKKKDEKAEADSKYRKEIAEHLAEIKAFFEEVKAERIKMKQDAEAEQMKKADALEMGIQLWSTGKYSEWFIHSMFSHKGGLYHFSRHLKSE